MSKKRKSYADYAHSGMRPRHSSGGNLSINNDPRHLSSEERALHRKQRAAEQREERLNAERAMAAKRKTKKKSDSVSAKWFLDGGVRIADTPVIGMIYAGANMRNMVRPDVPEPSLLSPTEHVADSSEGMEPIGDYPMYAYLTPEQRRGYIDFLASDRTEASDIGFVFLYLCGLERRLILDAKVPGLVDDAERERLVAELLRIMDAFGDNRSLSYYVAALLLYDGLVFDLLDENEITELFETGNDSNQTNIKSREFTDNSDAMSYMLVSRLAKRKMKINPLDLIACAKGRFVRSPNASMLGISKAELYDPIFDELLQERLKYCDLSMLKARSSSARVIGTRVDAPIYFPASFSLRKNRPTEINSLVCDDPEDLGIPLKGLSDMIVSVKKDIDECEAVLASSSKRDIGKVSFDALDAITKARYLSKNATGNNEGENDKTTSMLPLNEFLGNKTGATYVPFDVLEKDLKVRFDESVTFNSKGTLSISTQHLIGAAAASLGWQAMLPELIDGVVPSYWKVDAKSQIVMFERKTAHNKRNGKRCIVPIFGRDEQNYMMCIPKDWELAVNLAFIFAWFISKCPATLGKSYLTHFSSSHYPEYSTQGYKKNQIALFFSILHATYSSKLSTHGIKSCIQAVRDFADIQDVLFSLCDEVYGNMIPPEAMDALEEIYKKAGQDPTKILYDYHAGTYHVTDGSASGFIIDETRLADTIADTTKVQTMLDEAMTEDEQVRSGFGADHSDESLIASDAADKVDAMAASVETIVDDDANLIANNDKNVSDSSMSSARSIIENAFGDSDEMSTEKLLFAIVNAGLATTNAEAMGVISKVNADAHDELIEIDGSDAYWNA